MGIIDHISVFVTDLERADAFYTAALAPLGIRRLLAFPGAIGFGRHKPELWLGSGPASFQTADDVQKPTPIHVALVAESREHVDAFYAAALAAGAQDFGAPGPRPEYHDRYYGAFVLDPDGHNLEAVHHGF